MKKIAIFLLIPIFIFAATNSEIEKKLNYLIERMNKMEKLLNSKDKEIKNLKKEVKKQKVETTRKFILSGCDKIGVKNFRYVYNNLILPYYDLSFTIVNNYPYSIASFAGKLTIKDKDGSTILTDFISKDIVIKPKATLHIQKRHSIIGEIEKILKDEKIEDLKVTFTPTKINFTNGQKAKCGGLFNIDF